jgi:hypothetical protein
MAEARAPHPPSDPRPAFKRGGLTLREDQERWVRLRLAAALVLGLVLVASGLYMWRRPRTASDPSAAEAASAPASALAAAPSPPVVVPDAGNPSPVTMSDPRVVACHDRGPKKTPADQCDHVAPLERALSDAVEQSAACVPESLSSGTIEYVADVSFARRKVNVVLPRAGRSVRDRKVLGACASAVRTAMSTVPLEGVEHQHSRYRISVIATYRRSNRGG